MLYLWKGTFFNQLKLINRLIQSNNFIARSTVFSFDKRSRRAVHFQGHMKICILLFQHYSADGDWHNFWLLLGPKSGRENGLYGLLSRKLIHPLFPPLLNGRGIPSQGMH
jgi:hypothetical protein